MISKNEFNDNICKNLKILRLKHKQTTIELAKLIGVSRSCYSYYESGKREIDTHKLFTLALFYGLTLDEIVTMDFSKSYNHNTKFNHIKKTNGKFEYSDEVLEIDNPTMSLFVVTIDEFKTLIFSSCTNITSDETHVFEYQDEILVSNIEVLADGSVLFKDSYNNSVRLEKRYTNRIAIIGVLQSTINKEFDVKHFF